ncbi:lipoyl synthase [Candidatus Obscuribacterales bacterium]|jgi:lipoic acid synthetase|nr:lipoyl synthase [Candidatus Obscuribacterales bacterium]MBX3136305.1 lipoyl synthase [Candidatus Obscuribacterales bacterium]MBX3148762.1 lipoyl synthase [Candidatus Obscuribacterales bacterium]
MNHKNSNVEQNLVRTKDESENVRIGLRKPDWLRVKLPTGTGYRKVKSLIEEHELHTVCESAACPNRGECWSRQTATFMILGNICTRSCGFCNVITGKPTELDLDEPRRVADAVRLMDLKYAVITSVNRDELKDGGASVWAETIRAVREASPNTKIEVLIPDFCSNWDALQTVIDARPDVLNHNTETVPRLYLKVRPQGKFVRSMELLQRAKEQGMVTKSGIMVGLGETNEEILEVMEEWRKVKVDLLTLGQYMQPTLNHLPVERWVTPEEFEYFHEVGMKMGFENVFSGPLVRSSYHADEQSLSILE